MKIRNSARAVVLNENNLVLLFKFSFPDMTDHINKGIKEFWVTPGGGLKDGETFLTALHRELVEETGIKLESDPPWIWTREVELEWKGEKMLSHERYFLVRTSGEEHGVGDLTENEKATLKGQRWWSLQDIQYSQEEFRPPRIVEEIEKILGSGLASQTVSID